MFWWMGWMTEYKGLKKRKEMVEMDSFNLFKDSISWEFPINDSPPIICPAIWRKRWAEVEEEILQNLYKISDNSGRGYYLESMVRFLNSELYYYNQGFGGELTTLYKEYNISEEEIILGEKTDNFLHFTLTNSEKDLRKKGEWHNDYSYPRKCYFGFHLFIILSKAIEFVNKKIEEVKYGCGWQNEKTTNLPTQQTKVVDENDNQNTEATTPISQQPELDSTGQSRLNDKGYDRTLPQATKNIVSFEYEYRAKNGDALKNLMEHLVKNDFLKAETSIKDFKRIFYAVPLDNSFNKVGWVGALNELRFFIHELMDGEFVKCKSNTHWAIVETSFLLADKKTENHRPIKRDQLRNSKVPKDRNRKQLLLESLKILKLNWNKP
jgi:hypothetical protein